MASPNQPPSSSAPAITPTPTPAPAPAPAATPTQPKELPFHGNPPVLHYGSLAAAVLAPVALFMPSRNPTNIVQRAVILTGGFWAYSNLAHSYTGRSIYQRTNDRVGKIVGTLTGTELPERAARNKILMEAEKKRRAEAAGKSYIPKEQQRTALQKLWMGDETDEDWKARRLAEEKKKLDEGKGYGDLIMEQIAEVFGFGDKKEEKTEGKTADKKEEPKK